MDSDFCKKLIVGSIEHYFDQALQDVVRVGGGGGKAPAAIEKAKASLRNAAFKAEAKVYDDYELTSKLLKPGVDLAYRAAIVSDVDRKDEWIATLAVGFEELDEHTRKVLESWRGSHEEAIKRDVGETIPRRLLVFVVCAQKTVTMNAACAIANETADGELVLTPCALQWGIPQSDGRTAVVGHVELDQERFDQLHRMLSVIDSSHAAQLFDDHVRGVLSGVVH